MADNSDEKLRGIVNRGGFPFQIGIKRAVEKSRKDHAWKVITEEHPWKNEMSSESGFIDLILKHQSGTQLLLVECKRVIDCEWIFLLPSNNQKTWRAKSWTSYLPKLFDWLDFLTWPDSFESKFCVVRGQDDKKPMLEREASKIVEATEAFAMEEKLLLIAESNDLRAYFSVIVTTADLKICKFDHDDIDIKSGLFSKRDFEDVPFIRFSKPLTPRNEKAA